MKAPNSKFQAPVKLQARNAECSPSLRSPTDTSPLTPLPSERRGEPEGQTKYIAGYFISVCVHHHLQKWRNFKLQMA